MPYLTIPPRSSDPDVQSDMDSDAASEATLDELQSPYLLGEPLTRMVKYEYLSTPSQGTDVEDFEDRVEFFDLDRKPADHFIQDEEINYIEEDRSLLDLRFDGGDAEDDALLCATNLSYVHNVVDYMVANPPAISSPKISLNSTPAHPSHPLLVRHLHSTSRSSRELALWRYLNSAPSRRDPWNPSPPATIVERECPNSAAERLSRIVQFGDDTEDGENEAYIVMDRLRSLRDNPFKSTDDIVDFSRQMLQGLVFLHEHNITQASYALSDVSGFESVMMDIGLAPPHMPFSRHDFPVKYYVLDFTKAVRLQVRPVAASPVRNAVHHNRLQKAVSLPEQDSPRPAPYIRSLLVGSSVNLMVTLSGTGRGRAFSDSDMKLGTSTSTTPPDYVFDIATPKQPHFLTRPSSPLELSDPEDVEASSDGEGEEDGLRTVSAATRALLFAADLRHMATLLEQVSEPACPVREALAPVVLAMRRAKSFYLCAEDALKMFEGAVRPLVGLAWIKRT